MADKEDVVLNEAHKPKENAIEAFTILQGKIKHEILACRHHWDRHEPRMWSRAGGISDHDLERFDVKTDLVQVRSGPTSYGTVIFGKIRLPAIHDDEGEGFVHVRIHDPPDRGEKDVIFHSIFTDEGKRDEDGHAPYYRAIQTAETPLDWFNE